MATKGKKPNNADFECSYCGHRWTTSKFKMTMIKGSTKMWASLSTACPHCKRETTITKEI